MLHANLNAGPLPGGQGSFSILLWQAYCGMDMAASPIGGI
jgi:hypothetical protein